MKHWPTEFWVAGYWPVGFWSEASPAAGVSVVNSSARLLTPSASAARFSKATLTNTTVRTPEND